MTDSRPIKGSGLGLKRALIPQLQTLYGNNVLANIDFVEVAPENWLDAGSKAIKQLDWVAERYPVVCHGLCLSLGGISPLNADFIKQIGAFLHHYQIPVYTEHLSYCTDGFQGDQGYLYDLLPIPFTEEAVHYVATRIRQTQDMLGQRIGIENTSYYVAAPISDMNELAFLNAVLTEADCLLHLDINNVYVNSVNFGDDPYAFLNGIPGERIIYSHMAGHYAQTPSLLVDTHGEAIVEPVWELLKHAYRLFGSFPTLLERDNNVPPLTELMSEVNKIALYQQHFSQQQVSQHPVNQYAVSQSSAGTSLASSSG